MAYRYEQNPITRQSEIVIDGWENGIASSPHKGIASMKNVNISTENGEVMCSYNRARQTFNFNQNLHTLSGSAQGIVSSDGNIAGLWITVSSSTITGVTPGDYYVQSFNDPIITLSSTFSGSAISPGTSGSATYTLKVKMGIPVDKAVESYTGNAIVPADRYFILDDNGFIWVYDTLISGSNGINWFLPYPTAVNDHIRNGAIAVLNGWLFYFGANYISCMPTFKLDDGWVSFSGSAGGSMYTRFGDIYAYRRAIVGAQGRLYYTDKTYIGSIFPDTSLLSGVENIQSICKYTTVTTLGTINTLINGTVPASTSSFTARIPAVFFCATGGTLPTALSAYTVYWISVTSYPQFKFNVYAAKSGGSVLDITTGATGDQFFNTFCPHTTDTLFIHTPARLTLPYYEYAKEIVEIGNTVLIGGKTNAIYPWNQVDNLPGDIIFLPESDVETMLSVNNTAYIFAGNKGNIYISNGSAVSRILSVPDYCAGIAGTPSSYIEPFFKWGDAAYVRGRVYFSINNPSVYGSITQTPNIGGIWSFIPTQNFSSSQENSLSLRLENQNSYGDYDGVARVIIPCNNQFGVSPQFFTGWQPDAEVNTTPNGAWYVTGQYGGIDFTGTVPSVTAEIESDLIPTGTFAEKKTFYQIEYKVSSPLAVGDSVSVSYRTNSTSAWTSCGTAVTESTTGLSGYFPVNFEKTQWLQLKITLTSTGDATSSFCRLKEIRIK